MKTLTVIWIKPAFLFVLVAMVFNTSLAQNTKAEKAAKKAAEIKSLVAAKNYVFKAQYAQPLRGQSRYLTSDYDLTVGKDSLVAYLPYFGRAYVAPINSEDAGVMFTTTHFEYTVVETKNSWEITISPKNAKNVQKMFMVITKSGYATLQITSNNRDQISFQGVVEARKHKGKA